MKFSYLNKKIRLFSLITIYQRIQNYSDNEKLIIQKLYKMIDNSFLKQSFTVNYTKFMIDDNIRIKFQKLLNDDELKTIWNNILLNYNIACI